MVDGPVWAPVLRGADAADHRHALASLHRAWGIRASVRIFNWSGNPLSPHYAPTIALPLHSGVECPAEIVETLMTPSGRAR